MCWRAPACLVGLSRSGLHRCGPMAALVWSFLSLFAEAYGLPFLTPYLNPTKDHGDIKKGVNFAFSGAGALDMKYFISSGVKPPSSNMSLSVQLDWLKKFKPSLCKSKEGFAITLCILFALIEEGAVELVVPGNFPLGCNAAVLGVVNSNKKEDYDEIGCLIAYNTFAEYFNEKLKSFTSDKLEIMKACCGGSGPYHVDEKFCGEPGTTVCSEPSKLINWDGNHFTEAAYKLIAKGLVEGLFANPSLKSAPFKIT
ncbi:hypothetical protein TSUD_328730 [Trifolium subterraneum]|uniref:Uncharacterized protein n=1 Tax=Trifolium subterraneum TaxID=3900 RepID=A0A2Z6LUZ3_TRISU|nr:hypothetical protein TSUD_328730 [Trifolium subterraneum]